MLAKAKSTDVSLSSRGNDLCTSSCGSSKFNKGRRAADPHWVGTLSLCTVGPRDWGGVGGDTSSHYSPPLLIHHGEKVNFMYDVYYKQITES